MLHAVWASVKRMQGFAKIRGTILGVPITRNIVFWGLYWGIPICLKLPCSNSLTGRRWLFRRSPAGRALYKCDAALSICHGMKGSRLPQDAEDGGH